MNEEKEDMYIIYKIENRFTHHDVFDDVYEGE